jgi:hypothetical protein
MADLALASFMLALGSNLSYPETCSICRVYAGVTLPMQIIRPWLIVAATGIGKLRTSSPPMVLSLCSSWLA